MGTPAARFSRLAVGSSTGPPTASGEQPAAWAFVVFVMKTVTTGAA
jgi:hypothetical protein